MAEKPKRKSLLGVALRSLIFGQREIMSIMEEEQVQSPFRTIMKNFISRRLTQVGLVVFTTLLILVFVVPLFFPVDLSFFDSTMAHSPPGRSMMNYSRDLRNGNVQYISAGAGFGIGLSNAGRIYTWGTVDNNDILDDIPRNTGRIVQIAAGADHALALNQYGWVFTWGNSNFNLADIPGGIQGRVVQIGAGRHYSLALTDDGQMHVWGSRIAADANVRPQVLRGQPPVQTFVTNVITGVTLLEGGYLLPLSRAGQQVIGNIPDEVQGRVVYTGDYQIIAFSQHNGAAILDDGTVRVWGAEMELAFTAFPADAIGNQAREIVAGLNHFTVLLNDGTVISWGEDFYGQASPPNLRNIERIFAGFHHNYAVDSNGNIHTWGLRGFVFGSDDLGRDVFARTMQAGRYTMTVGVIAVVISAIIGLILGGFAGYFGGKIDMFIMRLSEIWTALPFLPLAIILIHILGHNVTEFQRILVVMVVLGVLGWPPLMRLVRGQIMQTKESEYVLAARCLGVNEFRIIFKHIFPNIMSVITVWLTLSLAGSMLTESGLSFIGFGITDPTPTWGNMISAALQTHVIRNFWWRWVPSAVFISLAAISLNLIGDGLREAIDPKAQER